MRVLHPTNNESATVTAPGSPKGQHKVIWTDAEWQAVALALLKVRPEYIDHPAPIFYPLELRTAMSEVLPPERHRPTPEHGGSMAHFRPGFLKAYQFIRETLVANGKSIDPELAALADLTLPSGTTPPAPTPAQTASFRNKKRIKWDASEFTQLAHYLRRRYPAASYLESSTCAGLHMTDVREAMLAVLPPTRHRPLFAITPLRPFFVAAFKAAKAEQYREDERIKHEKEAQEREAAMERAALLRAETAPPAPPANPYEAVFAPLMKPFISLLATELLAQLAPQITQLVGAALAAATATPPKPDASNDASPPGNVTLLPARHPAEEASPRKVVVGVVGPLPIQRNELERAFPHLHIVTHEGTNTNEAIARLRNARRVIGMTSFMNHSMDGALAKNFSGRYTRVTGGVSSIKRQIQLWVTAGELAA